ncbi:MAG: (Fe-S)-binding protein [Candidatus Hydrothermarchaeota archaeon]
MLIVEFLGEEEKIHKIVEEVTETLKRRGYRCMVMKYENNKAELYGDYSMLPFPQFDFLFIQGKDTDFPKILVGKWFDVKDAIATFGFNYSNFPAFFETEKLANFLEDEILKEMVKLVPNTDCKKCGYDCKTFKDNVLRRKISIKECNFMSDDVLLYLDGNRLRLNTFAKNIIAKTVEGMISSLKDSEWKEEILLRIRRL